MKKLSNDEFIIKSKKVHGNKYDYSIVDYVNGTSPITIICPIHGEFIKNGSHHLRGQGCPKCATNKTSNKQRKTKGDFVKESKLIHGDKYDYSKVKYVNYNTKVTITCQTHGDFNQTPGGHLSGRGCKYCSQNHPMNTRMFIEKSRFVFGDVYGYDKTDYTTSSKKVTITCPIHGDFRKSPNNHLIKKQGCPRCSKIIDTISFIEKSKSRFINNFNYDKTHYTSMDDECVVTCVTHGDIVVTPKYHINSSYGCKSCSNSNSKGEEEITNFLTILGVDYVSNDRSLLNGKELDIYIPEYNLAIEHNGLYWHSSEFLDKDYHLDKTINCIENKIKLIHIFEDEWLHKQEIVKSMIKHRLRLTDKTIFARKCDVRVVTKKEKKDFLNNNHLQGSCPTTYDVGLYYGGLLVSIMCFGKRDILKNKNMELIRFCNSLNTNVVGSFGKLFSFFKRSNTDIKEIISYCDRRWGEGGVYLENGFTFISDTIPNYCYIVNKSRESRYKYQKHKLLNMGLGVVSETEEEIMLKNNFYRIYDCGNKKYVYNIL